MHLVFNEDPLKITDNYSFRVEKLSGDNYKLWAEKTYFYDHPDAPGSCFVPIHEEDIVGIFSEGNTLFPLVKMLYLNQEQIIRSLRTRLEEMNRKYS